MKPMGIVPTSDHEWAVHAVNIHGVFFERWCQKAMADTGVWRIRSTNFPVEYPPPNGPLRGTERTLDIRAELRRDDRLLTLLIECKKNNPEFVNWILFPKYPLPRMTSLVAYQIENFPRQAPAVGWDVGSSIKTISSAIPVTDEARETRGSYTAYKNGDKTKTSNAAITEAAHQVALATQAMMVEEIGFSKALGMSSSPPPVPWAKQVFLPVIVTSAHIFSCEFSPGDVDPTTGEIPYAKVTLNEWPYLIFEYALPRHLQSSPADLVYMLTHDSVELFIRMHILVVYSGKFVEVLNDIASSADQFLV